MKNIAIALSVATALFASAAASAQVSEEYSGYTDFVSTKTRAEVRAETLAAIQRGEIRYGEQYPDFSADEAPVAAKTRAEVKAELAAYRKTHPAVSADIDVASAT
ncbi:DUF4148 domain-containing protein [Duganella sp. FT80W]|uniref:DUF4148 domain-containing protein n=1 Tax=Duganella guangzhouensis TaxID=2666084 RepID=A0A6I2L921_9BURK|nr:DUF4148 domain-containing protein [Duganella guangzhouensis]MRW93196.1 DUF4148 domain-containing protein [Duganella guangzhouensis]